MVTAGMGKLPTLKKNYEFQRVYGRGKYASSRTLVVYVLANRSGNRRLGITTSRKVGNSVVRNRIRRLIRENLRTLLGSLPTGRDIVVVARKADESAGFESVGLELRSLLARLGLLHRPEAKGRGGCGKPSEPSGSGQ